MNKKNADKAMKALAAVDPDNENLIRDMAKVLNDCLKTAEKSKPIDSDLKGDIDDVLRTAKKRGFIPERNRAPNPQELIVPGKGKR